MHNIITLLFYMTVVFEERGRKKNIIEHVNDLISRLAHTPAPPPQYSISINQNSVYAVHKRIDVPAH